MFAPFDAPVDEVRVLSGTVAVSGGVLRGLVRNWSRHLWAYGVTVTVGEQAFEWPLSVQPGEVAPFEIGGWDGPTDAGLIDIDVTAELSWHVDPSRAFRDRFTIPLVMGVGESTSRPMPDSVRDRYAHVTGDVAAGSVSVGSVEVLSVHLGGATSHLSLRDVYEDFAVGDLRGYGAVFDSHGRVVDVGPAPTVSVTSYDGRGAVERFEEVTRLPHPLAEPRHGSLLLRLWLCCSTSTRFTRAWPSTATTSASRAESSSRLSFIATSTSSTPAAVSRAMARCTAGSLCGWVQPILSLMTACSDSVVEDDDSGAGADALSDALSLAAGDYVIEASTAAPRQTGSFTLTVAVAGAPPPSGVNISGFADADATPAPGGATATVTDAAAVDCRAGVGS